MGVEHYAIIQQSENQGRWFNVATFDFGKDYELFMWLHSLKSSQYPQDIENFESLGEPYDDMHHYVVFTPSDTQHLTGFRYGDIYIERKGQPCYLYEGMLAAFVRLPGKKRIVICQDS